MLHRGGSSDLPYQTITLVTALTMNCRMTQEDAMRPVGRLLLTREGNCMDQGGGVESGEK